MREHDREWLRFDPAGGVLAVAVDDARLAQPLGAAAASWYGRHVGVVPLLLGDCSLTTTGLAHPTLRELKRLRANFAEHDRGVADSATRRARELFAAEVARLPTPLPPSVTALLADAAEGGDVCDGTLRLAAIACAGRIGCAAHPAAQRLHLELVAETLTTGVIPAGDLDRVAAALRRSGFVVDDVVVGSIDVPPGSDGAAARLRRRRVSGARSHPRQR